MKRMTAMLSAAAIVVLTAGLFAQATNFAGKWTRVDDPAAAAAAPAPGGPGGGRGGGRGGFGMEATITQDAKAITIEYMQGGQGGATPVKRVYNLDGSDSKNTMNFGGNAVEQVSKAKWDGGKLVITTAGPNGDTTQTLSLTGGNLVVESAGGRGPSTVTYKKAM